MYEVIYSLHEWTTVVSFPCTGGGLKPSTYRFVVDGVILTSKRDLELFIEVGFKYIVLGAFSFHPQFNLVRPIHGSPILITMGPIDIVK